MHCMLMLGSSCSRELLEILFLQPSTLQWVYHHHPIIIIIITFYHYYVNSLTTNVILFSCQSIITYCLN